MARIRVNGLDGTPEKEIEWEQHRIKIFGKWVDCPRLSAWYGDPEALYSYSNLSLHPKAWTPTLLEVRNHLAETIERPFNSVLLNFYRNGNDSMGWHSDDEWEMGLDPVIASISLGSSRMMKFRHRFDSKISDLHLSSHRITSNHGGNYAKILAT